MQHGAARFPWAPDLAESLIRVVICVCSVMDGVRWFVYGTRRVHVVRGVCVRALRVCAPRVCARRCAVRATTMMVRYEWFHDT